MENINAILERFTRAEELAKELAFAVKIHCEYENG